MSDELLDEAGVAAALEELDGWERDGDTIVRSVEAPTFLSGIELVAAVGHRAEEADHHPDIDIRWRTVRFALSTHSAGGLTEKDMAMARQIDAEARRLVSE